MNEDPLKNARKRFQEKKGEMSPESRRIAEARAKDLLADDEERNYQAKATIVRWILTCVIICILALIIVWFLYSYRLIGFYGGENAGVFIGNCGFELKGSFGFFCGNY